jgi:hypothetical protein
MLVSAGLLVFATATLGAQDRRGLVFGEAGLAGIGHSDSKQGNAPIFGGGAGVYVAPWLVVEADAHRAHVTRVFGQENHDFSESTFTGSVLFRGNRRERAHLIAGGGLGLQRAHSEFDLPTGARIDDTEIITLFHGRVGGEWDASNRLLIRTDAAFWFGGGLDWIVGGRVAVGYRF